MDTDPLSREVSNEFLFLLGNLSRCSFSSFERGLRFVAAAIFSAVIQLATNPFPANFSGIDFSNRFERFSMGRFIMKQSAPEAALSDYFT
jgi:hypothetical protein